MRFNAKRFYFYPGEGGGEPNNAGGSSADGGEGDHQDQLDNQNQQRPKYLDQVSPAKRDSEDYKSLYKYAKLEDLADAMINTSRENAELKKQSERTITIPEAADIEGTKAFYKKLGVPESADGYKLSVLGELKTDGDKMVADMIRKSSFEAKLTEKQAEHIGALMVSIAKKGVETMKNAAELKRKNADSDLIASYDDISADVDKKAAAEKDRAAYNALIEEAGLKELFDNNGISYTPKAVRALAAYARKHSGTALPPDVSKGKDTDRSKRYNYSEEFNNFYKR